MHIVSLAVGQRIRALREEQGLTLEALAYQSAIRSKGHLSNIERGLVRPTVHTLHAIAEALEVQLLDVVTFPDDDVRQRLVDQTRQLSTTALRGMLRKSIK